jgi:hypothetical protein
VEEGEHVEISLRWWRDRSPRGGSLLERLGSPSPPTPLNYCHPAASMLSAVMRHLGPVIEKGARAQAANDRVVCDNATKSALK